MRRSFSAAAQAAAPRRVLLTGSTGMVGRALMASWDSPKLGQRPDVRRLIRSRPEMPDELYWDPYGRRLAPSDVEGFDAVIHLAGECWQTRQNTTASTISPSDAFAPVRSHSPGENVGSGDGLLSFLGRWTHRKKHLILESRRRGTETLSRALSKASRKPKVLICASGVGYYGNCGDKVLDESSPRGEGFMADVRANLRSHFHPFCRLRCS